MRELQQLEKDAKEAAAFRKMEEEFRLRES
jgi:hypothetical protein